MSRLPDPIIEEVQVAWDKDYRQREDCLYKTVGLAIRKRNNSEKKKEEEDEK